MLQSRWTGACKIYAEELRAPITVILNIQSSVLSKCRPDAIYFYSSSIDSILKSHVFFKFSDMGLTAYVDSLYSTYLVVLIRLSYDDSIYLVIENMTYD